MVELEIIQTIDLKKEYRKITVKEVIKEECGEFRVVSHSHICLF